MGKHHGLPCSLDKLGKGVLNHLDKRQVRSSELPELVILPLLGDLAILALLLDAESVGESSVSLSNSAFRVALQNHLLAGGRIGDGSTARRSLLDIAARAGLSDDMLTRIVFRALGWSVTDCRARVFADLL